MREMERAAIGWIAVLAFAIGIDAVLMARGHRSLSSYVRSNPVARTVAAALAWHLVGPE